MQDTQDTFEEILIKRKTDGKYRVLMIVGIVLAVLGFFAGLRLIFLWLVTVAGIILAYYAQGMTKMEYEYAYVAGDLDVDRILNASRRKHAGSYELEKLVVLAPKGSSALDQVRSDAILRDYTSGDAYVPYYVAVYEKDGGKQEKVLLELSENIVKDMKRRTPRQVSLR